MFEIIAYDRRFLTVAVPLASSGGQIALDEFGNIRGIKQRGFDEDAGSELVVLHIGVDNLPVKCEAEDFELYQGARGQGRCEERTDTGIREVAKLSNRLHTVVQLGEPNGQIGGNTLV